MNPPRFGSPPATVDKIAGVLRRHPHVDTAKLYGSRARGNYRNGSDIDLTLSGEGLDHDELLEIMVELDELLLPYTIDLSLFSMLDHASLREHIERVGIPFFQCDPAIASLQRK